MVAPGVIIFSLALFFAYAIHQRIRGARLFRIAFFVPNVISSVAVALLWQFIYSTGQAGLLNGLLRHFHPREQLIPFTQNSSLLPALVPMIVWTATGFYMVLFLAAMENIPESYYEAARLDGASSGALFRHITLPLMWEVPTAHPRAEAGGHAADSPGPTGANRQVAHGGPAGEVCGFPGKDAAATASAARSGGRPRWIWRAAIW